MAEAYVAAEALVGLSISVETEDCDPWSRTWGLADVVRDAPLTPEHLLRSGSMTKTYTAALALLLAEEGLLSLDDPLASWGYDFADADLITVRMLLNHSSGLADYQANPDFISALQMDQDRIFTPEELIDYALALGPLSAPGEAFAYGNANYLIAARIIEAASEATYHGVLRAQLLDPLELSHSYFEGEESWTEPFANGYLHVPMQPLEDVTALYHPSQVGSSGAMVSTAEDLRRWVHALLATDLLGPDSQAELVDLVPGSIGEGYGAGVFVVDFNGLTAVGHNGAVMGFQSAGFYDPVSRSTVAVLHNQIGITALGELVSDPTVLALQLLDTLAEQRASAEDPVEGLDDRLAQEREL